MKTEKVILSFIAVLVGILVTGAAFYLYQSTRKPKDDLSKTIVLTQPSPTPEPSVFLSVKNPADESVVNKKVVSVEGSTSPDATVVIITPLDQQVLTPAKSGDFKTTVNIDDGQNFIEITAISPQGDETRVTRTITFSTEDF